MANVTTIVKTKKKIFFITCAASGLSSISVSGGRSVEAETEFLVPVC
jgi:hypothetical protein